MKNSTTPPSRKLFLSLVSLFAAFSATPLSAALLTVINSDFEADTVPVNSFISMPPLGWTNNTGTDHNAGVLNQTSGTPFSNLLPPNSGSGETLFAYAYSSTNDGNTVDSILSQVLTMDLVSNTTYTLTVDVGARNGGVTFNGYKIQLYAGATLLGEAVGNSSSIGAGLWITPTVTYTSGGSVAPSQPLSIQMVGINGSGVGTQALFDNVSLDATAVPEPSSALLCLFGGIAVLLSMRRRAGVVS